MEELVNVNLVIYIILKNKIVNKTDFSLLL